MFACLLVASSCFAQTAREHLSWVADTYRHLKTFQVEAEVERVLVGQPASPLKVGVALYVEQPDNVRIDVKANRSLLVTLISNGYSVVEYKAPIKECSRGPGKFSAGFDPDRGTGLGEMMYGDITEGVRKTTIRGQQTLVLGKERIACVVVDVEYSTAKRNEVKYSFWIARGLVFRRAVTFSDGKETHTLVSSVTALTANADLPENTFEFSPPPGIKQVSPPSAYGLVAKSAVRLPYSFR